MTEKRFKLLNTITGWVVFLVAAITYLLTIEPTVSFWDCGEFISSSNKMQIGHPPGAPFFMIIARFFAMFASGPEQVAMMINSMSALASAFTILFLFWTITFLAKHLIAKNGNYNVGNTIAILACSTIGSLAYTFSDTFWFSAVEGEVYAFSSFFTAIVFWAITKWYDSDVEDPTSRRWILLIGLMEGMAIGVHLLNLLTLPAIAFVVYYRKFKPQTSARRFWGFILTGIISLLAIAVIMWGIIPGVAVVASKFELLFTNTFGAPFNTGLIVWTILTIACLVLSIFFTQKSNSIVLNTIFPTLAMILTGALLFTGNVFFNIVIIAAVVFCLIKFIAKKHRSMLNTAMVFLTMILIGYSSYAIIIIRSNANPPMNQNNPEDMFNLLSYLNREQYGDRPLLYGQDFSAQFEKYENTSEIYTKRGDKYVSVGHRFKPVFKSNGCRVFPRMYSREAEHIAVYKDFGGMKPSQKKPTGLNNIKFFVNYQLNWMYWRYFLWNFSGRQNDIQGHGNTIHGNWITGFDAWDNARLGDQSLLPEYLKNNKGHNRYFMLPLILGLIGLLYQLWKNTKDWWIVSLLFILTGIAIVVYLNQTPIQPRERDYAYAGSFYAFAIWIGLGAAAIYELFKKFTPGAVAGIVALLICAPVPYIMAEQNWDDHDRSNRYAAHDFARNYLETCAPNAILFTHGDNDTFPVWYAQEVEGIRPDVKICCLPYFASDWYIDQMKCASYDAKPMPLSLERIKYEPNTRDQLMVDSRRKDKGFMPLPDFMAYINDDKNSVKTGDDTYYLFPSKKFSFKADPKKVIEYGCVYPGYYKDTAGETEIYFDTVLNIDLNREYLLKNEMMILDLLNTNNWERPIYITSLGSRHTLNLDNYFHNEGFAYRLTPMNKKAKAPNGVANSDINTDIMYNNLMNVYTWGNINDPNVYVDQTILRTTKIVKIRNNFGELAKALVKEGKTDKAKEVMARCDSVMPPAMYPVSYFDCDYTEGYYQAGEPEIADSILVEGIESVLTELNYYKTLDKQKRNTNAQEIQINIATLGRIVSLFQKNERTELFNSYYTIYTQNAEWYESL
ncbi:MAG: DUF2723 domain-containing protein [Bacteroidales bacterium]|nr:DUF2723 domain-containing protein [Bacteroidales bacterium]